MEQPATRIGLIIPVRDDAAALARLLAWRSRVCPALATWVVDGASSDDSARIAQEAGVRVLPGPAHRARQLETGARAALAAGCDALWFVHADALPSDRSPAAIGDAVVAGAIGGAFRRRFEGGGPFLRATCALADLRGRAFGWFLGDQAIFARADAFVAAGGFPDWPWFEDLELARRLRARGRTVLLAPIVLTSARRFTALGPVRRTWRDLRLTFHYWRTGGPPPRPCERAPSP